MEIVNLVNTLFDYVEEPSHSSVRIRVLRIYATVLPYLVQARRYTKKSKYYDETIEQSYIHGDGYSIIFTCYKTGQGEYTDYVIETNYNDERRIVEFRKETDTITLCDIFLREGKIDVENSGMRTFLPDNTIENTQFVHIVDITPFEIVDTIKSMWKNYCKYILLEDYSYGNYECIRNKKWHIYTPNAQNMFLEYYKRFNVFYKRNTSGAVTKYINGQIIELSFNQRERFLELLRDSQVPYYSAHILIAHREDSKEESLICVDRQAPTPDESSPLCRICETERINCVIVPCGHMGSCANCTKQFPKRECAFCRTKMVKIQYVFKV
jgi:hypothetical protein